VPKAVLEKALWYVRHRTAHIQIAKEHDGSFIYYVLRKDNQVGLKKIGKIALQQYVDACNGKKASHLKTFEQFAHVCLSMHFLRYAEPGEIPKCEYNPAYLSCPTCKGFRNWGICSHIVAINHILDKIDLEDQLKELSAPRKAGGFRQGVRPALLKEKEAEVDSSDEEDEPLAKRAKRLKNVARGPKTVDRAPPWKR
jgi:hypothetical protein